MSFVHLHTHTPFSYLDGAASIRDLAEAAAEHNMPALAMTDHDNVTAAVRFHHACDEVGIKPITGAEVTMESGRHLTLLAKNPTGYANLCRILTDAHLSNERLEPEASLAALERHGEGLLCLSGCRRGRIPTHILRKEYDAARDFANLLLGFFGKRHFYIELQDLALPGTRSLNRHLTQLAQHLGVGVVATNNVHHMQPEDFPIHDVLTCARTLTKLEEVHPDRKLNAKAYFRSPNEMAELFHDTPQALANPLAIAAMCEPALRPGMYYLPAYPMPQGKSARAMLRELVYVGARQRYVDLGPAVTERLEHELFVIGELGFDDYFLIVWDLLQFAKQRGIRFAGRGSAADSAVAYCLGITNVDSIARRLLFERFMSLERAALPDIDVDFDAERRDEVMQYVIERYGKEHVALVATYNTFRARSAVRDIGKALGLAAEEIDRLARHLPYINADEIHHAFDGIPEIRDSGIPRQRYELLLRICEAVSRFPRHLSTHLGGMVLTRMPLVNLSPIQMAAKGMHVMQFDKDDIEDLGMVKLDLLCLRTLSAVNTAVESIRLRDPSFEYEAIPTDDAATYQMIANSDTVGMFQLESPAQKALHARLQPSCFEDIVASVALIRPGPIQANMVDPYIARRRGLEPVEHIHPSLEPILGKTYGVVLFQEQVIEIAMTIGGFSPGEADQLRRAMKRHGLADEMKRMAEEFVSRAMARGVSEEVAREVFSYIHAYAGYGFCEAHAAAFGDTAYRTAFLKHYHPADFYAALLSHQPMGFYPANTLLWEAKRRGIRILYPDINESHGKFMATRISNGSGPSDAIRVSLRQIRGLGEGPLEAIVTERERGGPYVSFEDLCQRVRLDRDLLQNMIQAGAFDALQENRRHLLWQLEATLRDRDAGPSLDLRSSAKRADIRDLSEREKWWHEFDVLGMAVRAHPVGLLRDQLARRGIMTIAEALAGPKDRPVKVAGLVLVPHRPPTRSGRTVVFFTLEDETGLLDTTVFESVYQRYGRDLFGNPVVVVHGRFDKRPVLKEARGLTAMTIQGWQLPDRQASQARGALKQSTKGHCRTKAAATY